MGGMNKVHSLELMQSHFNFVVTASARSDRRGAGRLKICGDCWNGRGGPDRGVESLGIARC